MEVEKINHHSTMCFKHLIDEPRLRRWFQINVLHPERAHISKPEIQKEIGKKFNITDTQKISIYGFPTYGKRSSCSVLIYDKLEDAIKYEPNHRLLKYKIHDVGSNTQKNIDKRANKFVVSCQKERVLSHSFHPLYRKK